jgi:hypothetical protein
LKYDISAINSQQFAKPAIYFGNAGSGGKEIFKNILSACRSLPKSENPDRRRGLTAADYLANPVYPKSQHYLSVSQPRLNAKAAKDDAGIDNLNTSSGQKQVRIPATGHQKTIKFYSDPKVDSEIQKKQTDSHDSGTIETSITKAASKYGIPPGLIKAVIRAESNFDSKAVSSAGAQGLMQLMPATAEELGVQDPFDIDQNIDGGSRYLKEMLDRFNADIKMALAAYNAGPGTVEKYDGNVPYRETQNYVDRVMRFSAKYA